jgi:hypothetical protein
MPFNSTWLHHSFASVLIELINQALKGDPIFIRRTSWSKEIPSITYTNKDYRGVCYDSDGKTYLFSEEDTDANDWVIINNDILNTRKCIREHIKEYLSNV